MNTLEKIQLTIKANKNDILKSKKIRTGSIIKFKNSLSNNPETIANILKNPSKIGQNKKIFKINCMHEQDGIFFLENTPETKYGYHCRWHKDSRWIINIEETKNHIDVIKY